MSERFEPDAVLAGWLRRLPQYQYVADLVRGKRVLEVDCGTGLGAEFLATLGAARVVGIDRSSAVIREAQGRHRLTNLEFRCEDPTALELEDASFDLVIVPEGGSLLRRRAQLEELRRVLARDGCLVFAADSADRPAASGGVSYFDIVDRLEPLFAPVRMVAQSPFAATALVRYGDDADDSPDVQLDTSLLDLAVRRDDDVTCYLAVCGSGHDLSGQFTVVQMPALPGARVLAEMVGLDERDTEVGGAGTDAATHIAQEALARVRELQSSLAAAESAAPREDRELRDRLARAVEERDQLQRRAASLEEQVEEAQKEIGRVAAEAGIELNEARRDLTAMRKRVLELEAGVAAREGEGAVREFDRDAATVDDRGRAPEPKPPAGPPVSVLIAQALQAHAEHVAELEQVLDERSAYEDELREERDAAVADAERAHTRARELEHQLEQRAEELRHWRSRASTAEGELIKARRAAPANEATPASDDLPTAKQPAVS